MFLLLIAAAAGSGAWYYLTHREHDETRLVLQGNIDVRQVNLAFKVDGRIDTLAVDEGDAVEAGQVLATLDQRYFDDELRLAQARRDNQAATSRGWSTARAPRRSPRRGPRSPSGRPTLRDAPRLDLDAPGSSVAEGRA